MRKFVLALAIAGSAAALSACGTTNETVGTVGGAAVGGLAGHAVTGGSTLGTVGGAAVGGYVGHEVGQAADRR